MSCDFRTGACALKNDNNNEDNLRVKFKCKMRFFIRKIYITMSKKQIKKHIQNITQQIIEKYDPDKIILFGSFVYGKPKENSDVDLMVIKKTSQTFGQRLRTMAKITNAPIDRDIIVYSPREWEQSLKEKNPFIVDIDNRGKVLYEK